MNSRSLQFYRPKLAKGFTLVETIMVIVITGIIGSMVAVFIKTPIDSYIDSGRRAELTDIADTTVRRIARDVHIALPNSIRNPSNGSSSCVEFIPTKIGGRYRAETDNSGDGNTLNFGTEDDSFDMFWLNSNLSDTNQIEANDIFVISNNGYSGDAYTGNNAIKIASTPSEDTVKNTSTISFVNAATGAPFNRKSLSQTLASPFFRFQVIPKNEHVVGYICDNAGTDTVTKSGTGTLYRYSHQLNSERSIPSDCPAISSGASSVATLANNISSCTLKYEAPGSSTGLGNFGLMVIALEIKQKEEAVSIYHQVQVDNTP